VAGTFTSTTQTTDLDAVEEEDPQDQPQLALHSDDEGEHGPHEHLRCEAKATLRRRVGAIVENVVAKEENVVWTIDLAVTTNTRRARSADFREKGVGRKGGIPTSKDGDAVLLNTWLHLYPGKIEDDLCRLTRRA
jgi:hypothetical protein